MLAGLRPHPNIVRLLGICYEPPALVMELCGRDSLYDLLRRARRDPAVGRNLTWERRVRMVGVGRYGIAGKGGVKGGGDGWWVHAWGRLGSGPSSGDTSCGQVACCKV